MEKNENVRSLIDEIADNRTEYDRLQRKFFKLRKQQLEIDRDKAYVLWKEKEDESMKILERITELNSQAEQLHQKRQFSLF